MIDGPATETVRLAPSPRTWLADYASALAATSMGPTSREVVLEDSAYIADRAVIDPGDPAWAESRVRTGAVMGAVQSGKTASMIGVAARALDNGVNVVVVLAGTQTSLWLQTLGRVRAQLDSGSAGVRRRIFLPDPDSVAGATHAGPSRVYALAGRAAERALARDRPIVIVAMKQVDHLRHVGETLHKVVYPAAASVGRQVRLLVIDDEADDSSIADDSLPWGSPDLETFKQVPRRIIDLWETRSRPGQTAGQHVYATYLAYTATPQANFLQDPDNPLSPRDFVASLRTPGEIGGIEPRGLTYRVPEGPRAWYTGSDIFYGDLADTLCITEHCTVQPDLENDRPDDADLESLVDPVRAYLVAAAIRLLRAPGTLGPATSSEARFESRAEAEASTSPVACMLIHPASAMQTHFAVAEELRSWWRGIGNDGSAGVRADIQEKEAAWKAWLDSYRAAGRKTAERYEATDAQPVDREVPSWNEVVDALLSEVIPGTHISVINSDPEADERPRFAPVKSAEGWLAPPNHSSIFVAGNVMSRGLTLEGLLTTSFTRHSNAPLADTQMQMQRWFGYRGAYIELCRVFVSPEQLTLFTQYADADHALRTQVLAAMERSEATLPDFTVLQGTAFQATGKIAGLSARQLRPGSRPFVRHLNRVGQDEQNLKLVRDFFTSAHRAGELVEDPRGLVTTSSLDLLQSADLLDRLRYVDHAAIADEGSRWTAMEHQAAIDENDPTYPLYRAPQAGSINLDLGSRSPYTIAAYLRFWAASVDRLVRGLMTDGEPPQRWNLLSPEAKRAGEPRFRVGLRFGRGVPVTAGPVSELAEVLGVPVRPMERDIIDGNTLAAEWGSRSATGTGFAGDDHFDYQLLSRLPDVHDDGTRLPGANGLILFHFISRTDGRGAVALGLSIPTGGPDHVQAVSASRRRAGEQ